SIAILGNDGGNAGRMSRGDPKSGRGTVVEDIQRKLVEADRLGEPFDHRSDVVERVLEAAARWHIGLAEAWQIRSDDVKALRQQRNQVAEHVARTGKSMQQEQFRRRCRSGCPIENLETVHYGRAIRDISHMSPPLSSRRANARDPAGRREIFSSSLR